MGEGIYVRVSSRKQDQASQMPDLERYEKTVVADGATVKWYTDKATGKNMERPGWRKLEADFRSGKITKIVVWRLDRLGRTNSGLSALIDELIARKVGLVSLRDGVDLSTSTGKLVASILSSIAEYETEIRAERTLAGQAVARQAGTHMGRAPGIHTPIKVTEEQRSIVARLKGEGSKVAAIARTVGLARGTIYAILKGE